MNATGKSKSDILENPEKRNARTNKSKLTYPRIVEFPPPEIDGLKRYISESSRN